MAKKAIKKSATTKTEKSNKSTKDASIVKDAQYWIGFAKTKNVKFPFFKFKGHTYRTSDGKKYHSIQEFAADGGDWNKIQNIA